MVKKRNLWRWLTAFYMLIFFQVGILSQIEEFLNTDTTKIDSTTQSLKMILEKKDTTLLIPIDSLVSIPLNKDFAITERDPRRAWWYSAILPGLGQAYNRKHWKIPIFYTVFLGTYFMIEDNSYKYKIHKEAYANFTESGPPVWNPSLNEDMLKDRKDFYRRNRDLGIIIGVIMYFMNIMDASVDASLMDFDISDDLSMRVSPEIDQLNITQQNSFGLKFVITLNK
ncbi:MAG: hypothetical protein DRJ10_14180 [Bacteroidetes bacterium]|nr:MAG: hypothetical protein DRJ10_14180 [Bacteroidota bacterium]